MAFKPDEIGMILEAYYKNNKAPTPTKIYLKSRGFYITEQSINMFAKIQEMLQEGESYGNIASKFNIGVERTTKYCEAIKAFEERKIQSDLEKKAND